MKKGYHSELSRSQPPLELAWTTVAAKGLKKKVVTPHRSICSRSDPIKPAPEILYEDPDLATQTVVRKAVSIVQQALTPGAVVFSFPENLFSSRQAACHAIQGQIGVLKGVKCLSRYSTKPSSALIIESLFKHQGHTQQANESGIEI